MAYDLGELDLHATIMLRVGELAGDPELYPTLPDRIGKLTGPSRWMAPSAPRPRWAGPC